MESRGVFAIYNSAMACKFFIKQILCDAVSNFSLALFGKYIDIDRYNPSSI